MAIPRYPSLYSLIASQSPSAVAFSYFREKAPSNMTYTELKHKMENYPLPDEDVVGIFAKTEIETVVALLSLIGKKRVVLLSPDDPLPTLKAQIQATHVGLLLGDDELINEFSSLLDPNYRCEDHNVLFFTSGTTSKAKAVVLTEESLCNATYNGGSMLPLSPRDKMMAVLPLSHVFGFVCSLLWPLSFGASVCLGRGLRSIFFDFAAFSPTVATLVPQMAAFLLSKDLFNPQLKLILIGAGDCPDTVLLGIKSKGIRVSFGYGLTETSSGIALSIGEDPRQMSVCPDYEVSLAEDGEILVKCDKTMMQGYYEDEDATQNVLHEGILHTGDLGTLNGDKLTITGRKKEILVFDDGSKIYLPEYEAELAQRLGPNADFAVTQTKKGATLLYIFQPKNVETAVERFNIAMPRSHKIAKIKYAEEPLPRTKTGKVQRYLIPVNEGE